MHRKPSFNSRFISYRLQWKLPQNERFKLNCNASFDLIKKQCGIAGLIRNLKGECVKGFIKSINDTSPLLGEIKALFWYMNLAAELCISNLVIEMDS